MFRMPVYAANLLRAGGVTGLGYVTAEGLSEVSSSTNGAQTTLVTLSLAAYDLRANKTYLGFWTAAGGASGNTGQLSLRIRNGASVIYTAQMEPVEASSPKDYMTMGGMFLYSPGASPPANTFDVQVSYNQSVNRTAKDGRISLLVLGDDDYYQQDTGRITTTSTTQQTATTLNFTPDTPGDYYILVSALVDLVSTTNVSIGIEVSDGTTSSGEITMRPKDSADLAPFMAVIKLTGVSGATSVTLKYRQNNTGSTTVGISQRRIVAIRADRFTNVYFKQRATGLTSGSTSYVNTESHTFTPQNTDHLFLGYSYLYCSTISASAYADVVDDTGGTPVVVNEMIRENGVGGTPYVLSVGHSLAEYANSSRTQAVRQKTESGNSVVRAGATLLTLDLDGV